ncbi:cytidine deaminase [uncultured Kriegella sp.]|uniref:cytidine deaminase n=1 Tax=uncultured Kriegella sp. TaxID=1798910 RepID=UPI0030D9352A|tara:strand:- start:232214 stop:232699 length:486 start_codon:yes stop_codon:yes gene_type:complete
MRKQKITIELSIFETIEDLPSAHQELMRKAVEARKNAYAPYSNFEVGAAVLLENGEVVIGNNQENASYPSGLCAERVAVFQAGAKYPGISISSIAISATSKNYLVDKPAAPCGNCRQAISEYEVKQRSAIKLFLMGETGEVIVCNSLADILPLAFDSSFLE